MRMLCLVAALVAWSGAASAGAPPPVDYDDPANWLCRPDMDDVCDVDMDATLIRKSGGTRRQRFRLPRRAKFDCFYVYPTISIDETPNSDLVPGVDEELYVVRQQAARLGSVCRVFAPVYRQVTLTALLAGLGGNPTGADGALAYGDVRAAFEHYLANDNEGRGVLLIGHSQGAGHLRRLIQDEIDPSPERRALLVSAMLLGTTVEVPIGGDVGGSFANIPLCRSRKQSGCVVSYASFRSTAPPPPNSRFGGTSTPGMQAACTNPAALDGGRAALDPYFPTEGRSLPISPPPPPIDWAGGRIIPTPFVRLPRFLDGECAEANGFHYLEITVNGDPDDPRVDDIGGDILPDWGLHLVDANVAMGSLVRLAKRQARAHRRGRR